MKSFFKLYSPEKMTKKLDKRRINLFIFNLLLLFLHRDFTITKSV